MYFHLTKDQAAILIDYRDGKPFEAYSHASGICGQKIKALESLKRRCLAVKMEPEKTDWWSKHKLTPAGRHLGNALADMIEAGSLPGSGALKR